MLPLIRIPVAKTSPPPLPLHAGRRSPTGLALLIAALLLAACAGEAVLGDGAGLRQPPRMTHNAVYTADGADLPLRRFLPSGGDPTAVIVAVHGFNDYSAAFGDPGLFFRRRGIALYAYDQRGFGDAPLRGRWAGQDRMVEDLATVVDLVRAAHPGKPVFVMGESMGGALTMVAAAEPGRLNADGIILVAPAVRGRATLTWLQRAVLDTVSSLFPWLSVTAEGFRITPSDNYRMLVQLSRDPLIIKRTRADAVRGLVDLMDSASRAVGHLALPALILAGARDEVITPGPTCRMLTRLAPRPPAAWRFVLYPRGYHMLLRDKEADLVMTDIARWMEDRSAPLPSGFERLTGPIEPDRAAIGALPSCRGLPDFPDAQAAGPRTGL